MLYVLCVLGNKIFGAQIIKPLLLQNRQSDSHAKYNTTYHTLCVCILFNEFFVSFLFFFFFSDLRLWIHFGSSIIMRTNSKNENEPLHKCGRNNVHLFSFLFRLRFTAQSLLFPSLFSSIVEWCKYFDVARTVVILGTFFKRYTLTHAQIFDYERERYSLLLFLFHFVFFCLPSTVC